MVASWMASGQNFSIVREFRYLQTRAMLSLQDELREMEMHLYRLDERDRHERPKYLRSRQLDDLYSGERQQLMTKIRQKWMEYGMIFLPTVDGPELTTPLAQLLNQANQIRSLEPPSRYDSRSIRGFFETYIPLVPLEDFLFDEEDLVNIEPGAESAWLDQIILKLLIKFRCCLTRVRKFR
jgi:hypothetical protein